MKYNNIDYSRCVLICMVVMIHIVNFSTLYPDVKNFINFFFMQAFLLITGYLVNIRKTYKEFASYTMKIIIPYIIMVTGYAFVSTLLPVRDGVNEFTIPIILNTIFVNPAKRNVLDLKNETCKNREKRNVLKISHTRHFKTTKKQSKTGCFYSF